MSGCGSLGGKCEVCGKEAILRVTFWEYGFKCDCHSPEHFLRIEHCSDCIPEKPLELIHIEEQRERIAELEAERKPKPVIIQTEDSREYIDYICPKCKEIISQQRKGQKYGIYKPKYHAECGQCLNWEKGGAE